MRLAGRQKDERKRERHREKAIQRDQPERPTGGKKKKKATATEVLGGGRFKLKKR